MFWRGACSEAAAVRGLPLRLEQRVSALHVEPSGRLRVMPCRIHNADVHLHDDYDIDDLVDVIEGRCTRSTACPRAQQPAALAGSHALLPVRAACRLAPVRACHLRDQQDRPDHH